MKLLSLFLFSIFISSHIFSQDINAIIKEADRLEAAPDEKAAFAKFKEVIKIQQSTTSLKDIAEKILQLLKVF